MNIQSACLAVLTAFILGGCDGPPTPSATTSAGPPAAEGAEATSRDFGDYVVHFNALATDRLTAEVAKTYDIARSKNRALLNVSVVRKADETMGKPVAAAVTALVANDTGQVKDSNLREVREGESVYYIADFAVANGETLVFTLEITPAGENTRHSVRFTRTFYGD